MIEPYYQDDHVTIYHGDCLDIMPEISGVDLVFTSPPYNQKVMPWTPLGHWKDGQGKGGGGKWSAGGNGVVEYDSHGDNMPWPEYETWQRSCLAGMWETLSPTGAIFYNHKPRVAGERVWLPTTINEAPGPRLPLRQIVIWARPGGINSNPHAYQPTHEWIMIYARSDWRLKSRGASAIGDVWSVAPESSEHPAPFPLGLPSRAIETADPALVLDPFMGSGTTLRAAADAGVRAIGIDESEAYCEMAANRMGQLSLMGSARCD